jgi:hypothetical protein
MQIRSEIRVHTEISRDPGRLSGHVAFIAEMSDHCISILLFSPLANTSQTSFRFA